MELAPKLNPLEGTAGLTADAGVPPNEKLGLEGVAALEADVVAPKEKFDLEGVGAAGANEMFANGLALGEVSA